MQASLSLQGPSRLEDPEHGYSCELAKTGERAIMINVNVNLLFVILGRQGGASQSRLAHMLLTVFSVCCATQMTLVRSNIQRNYSNSPKPKQDICQRMFDYRL